MPQIVSFILADDVAPSGAVGPNNTPVPALINPQPVLRPQYIPGTYSFAFSLSVRDIDITQGIKMSLSFEDPDGNKVANSMAVNIPPKSIQEDPEIPSEYRSFTVNISVRNIPFEKTGIYHLTSEINGVTLEKQPIPVFLRSQKIAKG